MRPIRLTMTAFGPYAGTEVVDFTAALDAGIFGIYGETGAGKTTIFDGISFALFGQSSGAERTAEDMVCHHANATDITQVELVFDLGNERYVVRRIPRQQRAALRGSGTTTEPHQAYLFRATGTALEDITVDNPGQVLAEKQVNRVDPEIETLLGYNAAQFRQIVLLPQGDFRKILTATNDERSPILKRLFDVRLYEGFVDRIKRDAAVLHRQISDERVRRDTLLDGQSEEDLSETICSMSEEMTLLETTVKTEAEALAQHQKSLSDGVGLAEKFDALAAARKEERALRSENETIKSLRTRLSQARAAQSVLASEATLRSARENATSAQKRRTEAVDNLTTTKSTLSLAKEALDHTTRQSGEREAARARVLELERFRRTIDQSGVLLTELNAAKSATQSAIHTESEAKRGKSATSQNLADLRELQKQEPGHARTLQDAMTVVNTLEREAEALGRYETALTKRNQQADATDRLKTAHDTQIIHLAICKTAFERAEQDLTDIQALHIARKLSPGEPCPACGSLDHPDPATGDPGRRGRHDQFEVANTNLREAERLEIEASAAHASAQSALDDRQKELDELENPTRDRQVLLPVLTEARENKAALEADDRFAGLAEKIGAAEEAARKASSTHDKAQQALSDCRGAETQAQTAYDTLLRDVPADWRYGTALELELSSATSTRDQLLVAHETAVEDEKKAAVAVGAAQEGVLGAEASVKRTSEALVEAQGQFTVQLRDAGLDEAAFQLAQTDVAQSGTLEGQVNSFDRRVAANTSQLARLTQDIGERSAPDISALTAKRDAAQETLGKSQESLTRVKTGLENKQNILGKVQALTARIGALEAEYARLGGLSDLVNGNNDRKVRLPDFAIAAMFDEVLIAANHRLGPMTGGRYQLLRPEDVGGGRQKRGLDIAVFDANTEKSRPTKTLSGGEGFQASLALALGLSDVVQRNSGGIKLDAIFIDEGFGTLDEDSLNTALETLYDLTNDMRSVGLISHTEQVKSVITEGFDIEVTPSGSHIHVRRTAA